MTHETISNIVSLFSPEPLPVELYVDTYHDAQLKLFAARYGEHNYQSLRKFKKVKGENDTAPIMVSSGIAEVPSDYFCKESGWYYLAGEPVRINFVEDYEYDTLLTHKIEYPSAQFPIGNVQADYIRFAPKTVKHVYFSYFTKPEPPTYAVTYDQGYAQFSEAESSNVLWAEDDVPALIQLMLQSLNIKTTQTEIKSKLNEK